MDAGRAYNTYPLMGGRWVPEDYWELWDQGYGFRNFFENVAAVQVRGTHVCPICAARACALGPGLRCTHLL